MHHHHHHGTGKILQWSFVFTILFVVVEIVAGVRAHSLALLSDAGHNFTDAFALVLAALPLLTVASRANDVEDLRLSSRRSAGGVRKCADAGGIAVWIFYEAGSGCSIRNRSRNGPCWSWRHRPGRERDHHVEPAPRPARSQHPRGVHPHGGRRAQFVGDHAAPLIIRFTGWQQIDPVLSILIGVLIVWSAWDIIRESLNILLEGLPRGLELNTRRRGDERVDGVIDVHDLHIWSLGSNAHALSCHVQIEDMPPSESESILRRINEVLCGFHIHHTTIQFEHAKCESECSIVVPHEHSHEH